MDSSGWIEYLLDRPLAKRFATFIAGRDGMIVSAIQIYEVYKVVRRARARDDALEAVAALRRARVVPVDETIAIDAADIAIAHRLTMADAIIYATARRHDCELITADADFDGLPGVTVVRAR